MFDLYEKMTPEEINSILIIPKEGTSTSIKTVEAEFIYDFIIKNKITNTLEIGFAYAKSASHIIAATRNKHIVIDPFQENYQNLGVKNIESLKLDSYLVLHNDYSHNVLPQLVQEKKSFDFIFIDGDHKFDGEFIDFYYSDMLLEKEGYILMHDTWMRSTQLVLSFIKSNRKDYRYIKTPLRNLALFQKIGEDSRNGMFFKEFYTYKSLLVHSVIVWLSNGKSNLLKRMVFWLKEKLK